MKGIKIKQNILNFQDLTWAVHSKACIAKKKKQTHYPIPILVLNVLVYIFEVKKRCKKKSLNKLPLTADSLK